MLEAGRGIVASEGKSCRWLVVADDMGFVRSFLGALEIKISWISWDGEGVCANGNAACAIADEDSASPKGGEDRCNIRSMGSIGPFERVGKSTISK